MSRAFPGWRTAAIHKALNEAKPSGWTQAVLEHLGRTLGERDGTGPDDDPLSHSLLDQGRTEAVLAILRVRGVPCSENPLAGIPDGLPVGIAVAAALACHSERDFHARLRAHAGK